MIYYDPLTPQLTALQNQLRSLPPATSPQGLAASYNQQAAIKQQMHDLTSREANVAKPMGTPDAMAKPTALPASVFANPFANMAPGFGTAQGYSLSQPSAPPPTYNPPPAAGAPAAGNGGGGIGQYTNTITANLPQSAIDTASAAAMKPVANPFSGSLAQQLGDYTRAAQSSGALDLRRDAAQSQAKMNLANQSANANSGLNWSDLLARLNESATSAKNAVAQPLVGNVLSQLLAGAF